MMKRCLSVLPALIAAMLVVSAFCATGYAGEEWVMDNPEIDPGSMGSALALLAGAGMLMADKLRRKAK
jgi:hypothetical protein